MRTLAIANQKGGVGKTVTARNLGRPVMIGRSVKVAQAAGAGQTIGDLAPTNPQAAAYKQLSEEIIQWSRNA